MKNIKLSCLVEKESIPKIQFSKAEVLLDKNEIALRNQNLNRALQLGNLLKNKVNIYFRDYEEHVMRVHTTIWAITADAIILKQGISIPRNCVVLVD